MGGCKGLVLRRSVRNLGWLSKQENYGGRTWVVAGLPTWSKEKIVLSLDWWVAQYLRGTYPPGAARSWSGRGSSISSH